MKRIVLASIGLCFPALVQAQEAAPEVGGARIEARGGWDHLRTVAEASVGPVTARAEGSDDEFAFGLEAGFDLPVRSRITLGGYVGIEGSTQDDCTSLSSTERLCLKARRNLTVGGRAGYAFGRSNLVYAKGGYSNGGLRGSYEDTAAPADNDEGTENLDGYHLGAGLEIGLPGSIYGKLEYLYTDYRDFRLNEARVSGSFGFDKHQVLVGAGVRFCSSG